MSPFRHILTIALATLAWSGTANAGDCASGSTHTGTCTPSGGTDPVCVLGLGGALLNCDARANYTSGTVVGALVYAIYDDPLAGGGHTECGDDYCVWGDDVNGDAFCCAFNAGTLDKLNIVGTSEDDDIYFHNGTYNLEPYSTTDFSGQVVANGGADFIEGSYCSDDNYTDELFGGDGDDEIWGRDGFNKLHGEDGVDVLEGGADVDHAYGGAGADTIKGAGGGDPVPAEALLRWVPRT